MEYKIIEKWHLYPPCYSDQQKNPQFANRAFLFLFRTLIICLPLPITRKCRTNFMRQFLFQEWNLANAHPGHSTHIPKHLQEMTWQPYASRYRRSCPVYSHQPSLLINQVTIPVMTAHSLVSQHRNCRRFVATTCRYCTSRWNKGSKLRKFCPFLFKSRVFRVPGSASIEIMRKNFTEPGIRIIECFQKIRVSPRTAYILQRATPSAGIKIRILPAFNGRLDLADINSVFPGISIVIHIRKYRFSIQEIHDIENCIIGFQYGDTRRFIEFSIPLSDLPIANRPKSPKMKITPSHCSLNIEVKIIKAGICKNVHSPGHPGVHSQQRDVETNDLEVIACLFHSFNP